MPSFLVWVERAFRVTGWGGIYTFSAANESTSREDLGEVGEGTVGGSSEGGIFRGSRCPAS